MTIKRTFALPLAAAVMASGCVSVAGEEPDALTQPNPLSEVADLLAAAEQAATPERRLPLLARLDAMQVSAAQDAADDPLSHWRAEAGQSGAAIYRGRTLGPAYRRARLAPGARLTIEQIFYAGQRAEIAAQTSGALVQGSEPVAMAISNPRREEVCIGDLNPRANCGWLPLFTERFSITLENHGLTPASVYLVFR